MLNAKGRELNWERKSNAKSYPAFVKIYNLLANHIYYILYIYTYD